MQSSHQLRILIADDHEVVRRGLKMLLSAKGWVVCAEAATGRDAITKAEQHRPDIVVMDIAMPGLNGLEAGRKILKMLPKTEILVFSAHYSDQLVREVIEAGARAYVLKSDADRDLVLAVEALANHRSFFTAGATDISRPDADGIMSDGILQFHRGPTGTMAGGTWEDFSRASGITGSPKNPADAIRMTDWAISHGLGPHWTCWRLQISPGS